MRILLIKTSSLGDVIHNLPVVTDLATRFPCAEIDWVVEEGYADIVRLNSGVRRAIPVAIRRWRKSLFAASTWDEMGAFRAEMRGQGYDLVLDTQGLLKSAVIARMARGRRCGYASGSAREPAAARFYDDVFDVPTDLHAIERNRRLAALACDYSLASAPDYGIGTPRAAAVVPRQAVLLTASSRDDKLWPEERWTEIGNELHENGLNCLLPSGNAIERERAARVAAAIPGAVALPPLGLGELAQCLASATLVIGVDTGLVHLGAALGRPTIALFCASDPALTGVLAGTPAVNLGTRGHPPQAGEVITAARRML